MKKLIVAVVCALMTVGISGAEPRTFIKNGDFEDGLKNWIQLSWMRNTITPEIDAAENQGIGCGSLKIVGDGHKHGYFVQQFNIPRNLKKVRVSGYMKTEGFQNSWAARIQVEFFSQDSKQVGRGIPMITPVNKHTTDWTLYSKEITIPENARFFRLILLTTQPGNNKPNAGTAWFDNIEVVEVLPESAEAK